VLADVVHGIMAMCLGKKGTLRHYACNEKFDSSCRTESNFSLQAKETTAHIFLFVIIYIFVCVCMRNWASHVYSVYCSYPAGCIGDVLQFIWVRKVSS
jgi:hypothetical protein